MWANILWILGISTFTVEIVERQSNTCNNSLVLLNKTPSMRDKHLVYVVIVLFKKEKTGECLPGTIKKKDRIKQFNQKKKFSSVDLYGGWLVDLHVEN
ncbi:hypothetical protein DERP_009174 [Dermatophagoides pteronyssinus]|uniref:Secreted protein n=1 Tax=Dermatophagoides pteronyssinus TaxID=6956 RepID=A0ABQ8JQS4_DERPT|nr:hypothetical protein DERP_009174 [Dermatophagoides pteronyssinus]